MGIAQNVRELELVAGVKFQVIRAHIGHIKEFRLCSVAIDSCCITLSQDVK